MNQNQVDPLLREILASERLAQLRDSSFDPMMSAARSRRNRRRFIGLGALTVLMVLLLSRYPSSPVAPVRVANTKFTPPQTLPVPAPEAKPPTVRFIDDEELFALFPDRPLALIGPPGEQRLVFLDENTSP